MHISRFAAVTALFAATALVVAGCSKDSDPTVPQPGTFSVNLENVVGTQALRLSTTTYATAVGDNFTVGIFKYYLSNLVLTKADGSAYAVPNSHFLVDQAVAASQQLTLKDVPAGDYTGLRFTVGVDSARTKAAAFAGALDASNGMWWDWSKEFINVKLEGTSPQSPRGGLVFHIAGFKGANGANNTIRTVTLAFPGGAKLPVRPDHSPQIHIQADVLGMFGAPNPVRFATLNTTMGGPQSVLVANNIAAGMFTVEHIHAN